MIRNILIFLLAACGSTDQIEDPPPAQTQHTLCEYVEGVCIVEESFSSMDIDYSIILWSLQTLEYETNFFYPGLEFSELAEKEKLILIYKWADWHTQYKGTYTDFETTARVYLRRGDNITSLMECMDRYDVALHEVLHFISERYLFATYENGDVHYVPYIFKHWAVVENLPTDYTVEGRLYTLIWRLCYDN